MYDEKTFELERDRYRLGLWRILSIPLGLIMYFATMKSLGQTGAMILGCAAAVIFWLILSKGRERLLYDAVAEKIHDAIKEVGRIDSQIEMKRFSIGLVVRIFLIDPGALLPNYTQTIHDTLAKWDLRNKSMIVQISGVRTSEDIDKSRVLLDKELLEEIKRRV